ncbi:DUF1772 domain-containing protein [Micromonospora coerulea]|uniref:DUF1772 domain-containing protein n=1 Tax=Micromonospora coerulea TaxID=47856 RepID=A0ABP8S493_9ACTN|nr:DUF1772 domain-containing protein [Micromonospora veneta]
MMTWISGLLGVSALVASGITAGVLFAVAVSVLPTLFALPAGTYIRVHRLLGKGYHPVMPIVVNVGMVADFLLVPVALDADHGSWLLFLVAGLLLAASQFVSHLGNVPINRQVKRVDPDAVPADWWDPRPKWQALHRTRTSLAVGALVLNAIAVVTL